MYKYWLDRTSNIAIYAGLALGLCAVGCGDDEGPFGADLEGVYQIVAETENSDGCDQEGESSRDEDSPDYFRLSAENWLGQRFVGFNDCDAPDTCDDSVSLGAWIFTEQRDDHWFGEPLKIASPGSGAEGEPVSCSLGLTRVKAFVNGDDLRMESRQYTGSIMVDTEDACETELASLRFDDLTCSTYKVLEATRAD